MTERAITSGAVLAAGEGSRFQAAGWTGAKPLIKVAGVPLIGHVLENFAAAGIGDVTILFNEREADCAEWVRENFRGAAVVLKTTASSYESFRELSRRLPGGRALFSTVDAFCRRADFVRFAKAAAEAPADATLLAVTPFVADEKPLFADLDRSGRIRSLGAAGGEFVTAGLYAFSQRARTIPPPEGIGRLREFLSWLARSGEPLLGIPVGTVVDVDRPEDVELAEELAAGRPPEARRAELPERR